MEDSPIRDSITLREQGTIWLQTPWRIHGSLMLLEAESALVPTARFSRTQSSRYPYLSVTQVSLELMRDTFCRRYCYYQSSTVTRFTDHTSGVWTTQQPALRFDVLRLFSTSTQDRVCVRLHAGQCAKFADLASRTHLSTECCWFNCRLPTAGSCFIVRCHGE